MPSLPMKFSTIYIKFSWSFCLQPGFINPMSIRCLIKILHSACAMQDCLRFLLRGWCLTVPPSSPGVFLVFCQILIQMIWCLYLLLPSVPTTMSLVSVTFTSLESCDGLQRSLFHESYSPAIDSPRYLWKILFQIHPGSLCLCAASSVGIGGAVLNLVSTLWLKGLIWGVLACGNQPLLVCT